MKLSSAITAALAPVALAKVVRNKHPEAKRDPSFGAGGIGGVGAVGVGVVNVAPIVAVAPVVGVSNLLLLYTNSGGGAVNNVVNSQVTVTQTVTVPQGGQATQIAGVDGVTQTIQPGATGTMVVGAGQTHVVQVGGSLGKAFFPADITANIGDTILFNFMSQNHSVTQASFDQPCVPLSGGMDSGFMPNQDNTIEPAPQVAMQVMTSEPLWMYCAQGDHCRSGMVLSINPTLEKTHAQFQANAIGTGNNPPTAITGGAPGGAPAGAPPAGDPAVADPAVADPNLGTPLDPIPVQSSIVNDPNALPTIASSPATGSIATGALNGGLVMGIGTVNADGSCNCAVQCASGSTAGVPADVGLGGFGGQVAVIPMNAAGVGAASIGAASIGAASVDPLGAASASVGVASVNSVDAATVGAATASPLGAASVQPAAAGAATGLVAPDPSIVGRRR